MKKLMKLSSTLLVAALVLVMAGCQGDEDTPETTTAAVTTEVTTVVQEETTESSTETEPETTESEETEDTTNTSVTEPETSEIETETEPSATEGEETDEILAWLGEAQLEMPGIPEEYTLVESNPDTDLQISLPARQLTFDTLGRLTSWTEGDRQLSLEGLAIDVGWNEKTVLGQAGYSDMELLQTWDLPVLSVRNQDVTENLMRTAVAQNENAVWVRQSYGPVLWDTIYEDLDHALKITTTVTNLSEESVHINGVNYVLTGIEVSSDAQFEYPGSIPFGQFGGDIGAFNIINTQYSSPLTHITSDEGNVEVIFVNESEKWRTGSYFDWSGRLSVQHLNATQADLPSGENLTVGSMYLQLPETQDPYDLQHVRDLYTSLGWTAPTDGAPHGPVYVGHPYGTMDTGFSHPGTLQEYAEELPRIKAMGYDYIWLLPIFTHPSNLVYAPPDQTEIDPRYGGREGAEIFIARAHEEGLGVLFDLVPHGPEPHYPIVQENPSWPSLKRDGSYQIEWDCVSFDYNNQGYMDYTHAFIHEYAETLGLDGARIDCAMGGLSNWSPQEGFRPSESGLRAGLTISETVRQGIIDGGREPMILPENFHPVPQYAPFTDMFYDMTLYRVIYELRTMGANDVTMAQTLTHWLRMQREASPEGLVHLRYLSNHDTADWTWDAARPIYVHGVERSKAFWVVLSMIDGVPMLHAGDEDSGLYQRAGTDLTEFFTELNSVRENLTDTTAPTLYQDRDDAVTDFYRLDEEGKPSIRILVNFGDEAVAESVTGSGEMIMSERSRMMGDRVILEPHGFAIMTWSGDVEP